MEGDFLGHRPVPSNFKGRNTPIRAAAAIYRLSHANSHFERRLTHPSRFTSNIQLDHPKAKNVDRSKLAAVIHSL